VREWRRGRLRVGTIARARRGGGAEEGAAARAERPTPLGVGNKDYVYCLSFLFDYNSYI
jgi:hypothetical protein